jgi:predicted SnoaL-like aldol condensation-catalyzing enzyme
LEGIKQFIRQLPPAPDSTKVIRAFQDGPYVFTQEGNIFGEKVIFDIYRFDYGRIVEHWDNIAALTSPNQSGDTAIDGPTKAIDLGNSRKNKELIKDFYETIFLKGQINQMPEYFDGDNFVGHDARGGGGLSALGALMQEQSKQDVVMSVIKIEKILGQSNFILVAASDSIAGKSVAYYDLSRVETTRLPNIETLLKYSTARSTKKSERQILMAGPAR